MAPDPTVPPSPVRSGGSDPIRDFFRRPVFLSLTIGIPFCIFKLLFGLTAIKTGNGGIGPGLAIIGWGIVIWAGADVILNTGRIVLDLLNRPAWFEYCTIAEAGRIFHRPNAFLALDTLLTFSIICAMLWSGWIARLDTVGSYLWYSATTLNLISLSLVSLYTEFRVS
ncbi:MAG TPA: hypothetical protein VMT44_04855 [Methanoregula sp.]|nr:hypothetical protein [Methanoregula sp.]